MHNDLRPLLQRRYQIPKHPHALLNRPVMQRVTNKIHIRPLNRRFREEVMRRQLYPVLDTVKDLVRRVAVGDDLGQVLDDRAQRGEGLGQVGAYVALGAAEVDD